MTLGLRHRKMWTILPNSHGHTHSSSKIMLKFWFYLQIRVDLGISPFLFLKTLCKNVEMRESWILFLLVKACWEMVSVSRQEGDIKTDWQTDGQTKRKKERKHSPLVPILPVAGGDVKRQIWSWFTLDSAPDFSVYPLCHLSKPHLFWALLPYVKMGVVTTASR